MPAESERLRRRIGARDRLFLGLVAAALLAGIVVAVLASRHGGGAGGGADCVSYSHPNFTGGATYRYCGADAASFCRRFAGDDRRVVAQCARLSLPMRR